MTLLRHASFFSGVGGLDLGFENAGIRTVSLCEVEPYASAVLAERFPGIPNFGDITKMREEDIPSAEIYSGGFPCQDLSASGTRRGFRDGTRSSLAFRFLDIVEQRRPRWIVLENVPGLLHSNRGRDFGRLIQEMESLGYGLAWRTLDARFFGVPHRRRRVFIVAARDEDFGGLGGERAAEVLIECEGTCGHIAAGESKKEGSSAPASTGPQIGRKEYLETNPHGVRSVDGLARGLDYREELDEDECAFTVERKDGSGTLRARFGDECPACITGEVECEPYSDHTGVEVECSLCWDTGEVRPYGEEPALSFPSRFGSNAAVTIDVAQSFAHSAGAPAVMRGVESEEMKGEDPLNPSGLDTNRYRCIGNGVVAPVAEFIGRRIVAVDEKHWKEAKG
jgi:DNA-cytosine methyltransferase